MTRKEDEEIAYAPAWKLKESGWTSVPCEKPLRILGQEFVFHANGEATLPFLGRVRPNTFLNEHAPPLTIFRWSWEKLHPLTTEVGPDSGQDRFERDDIHLPLSVILDLPAWSRLIRFVDNNGGWLTQDSGNRPQFVIGPIGEEAAEPEG